MINQSLMGAGMFFVGFGIGMAMNQLFRELVDHYEEDHAIQMLIGITQLILISFIVYFFQESVNTLGLFITGILMAQELFILKTLPRKSEKILKPNKSKDQQQNAQ